MASITKHELNRIAQLEEDISSYKRTIKTLKEVKEDFKQQRDELSEKLDKECNDNYKLEGQLYDMTKQRDSLIKDVEKLRKDSDKYNYLTNYIKDKALHNPSVSRYIDLVHVIDELERDTHEG